MVIVLNNVSLCSESVDQVVEKYGLQKITLLREISVKTGIQVKLIKSTNKFLMSLNETLS